MSDYGTRYADKKQIEIENRLRVIYRNAQTEIIDKMDQHIKRLNRQDKVRRSMLASGRITQKEYDTWLNNSIFRGKLWNDRLNSIAETLLYANIQSRSIIEGEKRAVFGANATYQAYKLEHDAGLDLSFSVYDSATVTRLLRDNPSLLKPREINPAKDIAWNKRNVTNAVTQGIIQGDSIQDIAKRIGKNTASKNESSMLRYARTAMTGAQNAGRIEVMHEASEMGIKVKKVWISTLDERTRVAHQELDGKVQEIDKPFDSMLGPIDYPGDPKASDENIWNCRCTLGYEYPEYARDDSTRRDNITGEEIEYMDYNEWLNFKMLAGDNESIENIDKEIEKLRDQLDKIDLSNTDDILSFAKQATKATNIEYELQDLYEKRAAQEYPDDDVMSVKKHIVGKHTEADDIKAINPNFKIDKAYQDNCQRCVPAYEMRRRGYDVVAKPVYKDRAKDKLFGSNWRNVFENAEWIKCDKGSGFYQMHQLIKGWGNGARAEIYVQWKNGGTHAFIGENKNGNVVFRDPQSGEVIKAPFTARVKEGGTEICRIDNLKPTKLINECCEVRK